jgi:hypothetical protein
MRCTGGIEKFNGVVVEHVELVLELLDCLFLFDMLGVLSALIF